MKITNLFLIVFLVLSFITLKSFAQDEMAPTKPVDNKVYEAMCGQWTSESDMMGTKMKQDINIHWDLDHQFIFMELKAVGTTNPNIKYSGLGVFGVDYNGKAKVWWFDCWGASSVSTGDGAFEDNRLTVKNGNEMFSETRTFVMNGNEMTMSAKGTMKMSGKEMPYDETVVYKKK